MLAPATRGPDVVPVVIPAVEPAAPDANIAFAADEVCAELDVPEEVPDMLSRV